MSTGSDLDDTQRAAQEQFSRQSARYAPGHILQQVDDVEEALGCIAMPPSAQVLDVACSAGNTGLHLASLGHRVMCADLSADSAGQRDCFASASVVASAEMGAPANLIHHKPGSGKTYSAVGDKYVMLATGEQTGGAYCLAEAIIPPGGGPPPHYHTREEEAFYVLEGEITFTVEDRTVTGTPGTFVQIPRGTPHAFKNQSGAPARMLIQCSPAGFEKFMAEFATELPSPDAPPVPPSPEEIEKLVGVAPRFGIVILPPAH